MAIVFMFKDKMTAKNTCHVKVIVFNNVKINTIMIVNIYGILR